MALKFVYGSLMTHEVALEKGFAGFVKDHAIGFTHIALSKWEPSFANLEISEGDKAWGVIVDFNPAVWKKIKRREISYVSKQVVVNTPDGKEFECETFVLANFFRGDEHPPSSRYAKMLLKGAEHHKLPETVIQEYKELFKKGHKGSLRVNEFFYSLFLTVRTVARTIKRR